MYFLQKWLMSENNTTSSAQFVDAGYSCKVNEGNTYDKYNLQAHDLYDHGVNTGDQIIRYQNKHIKTLRQTYKVVPHEDLLGLVNVVADELGLSNIRDETKGFGTVQGRTGTTQKWGSKAKFGHATISHDGKYMSATYVSDKVSIGDVNADHNIFGGVSIMGSIDGSTSIRIMPMTLRTFCFNIMNHVLREIGMKTLLGEANHQLNKLRKGHEHDIGVEQRNVVAAKTRFYHRQNLEMDDIAESIKLALLQSETLLDEYRKLQNLILEQKMAFELVATMPQQAIKSAQFLEVTKDDVKITNPNITLYEVMNHFTQYLTYYANSKSMRSVYRKYGEVDNIFFNENRRTELLKPLQAQ